MNAKWHLACYRSKLLKRFWQNRKADSMFNPTLIEFRETGMSNKLGYNSVADLRANYPDFFWKKVRPYIGDALRYLRVTLRGSTVDCQPLRKRVLDRA